ncbi:MAG: leucine-rich repeat domain-containing protein [Spirochaetaceae bacterium]|nr:leucine-rich repeat domain-containing protein [Spirochaetaceae bacterium]
MGGSAASAPKAAKESYPKDNGSSKWLTIEDGVLTKCDSEAEGVVIIPEGVTEIGEYAFEYCKKITEIVIPASVTEIDSSSFEGDDDEKCTALCAITVAGGNKKYKSADGVLYSDGGETLLLYPYGKKDEEFTVPDGVKTIDSFGANESLVSVKLPDSLEEIGDNAFCGCEALESIKIPASVTEIASSAFYNCEALCSITVARGNEEYKSVDGVLYSDGGKTLFIYPEGKDDEEFTVPAGVKKIGVTAFSDCKALESITLPDGLKEIGESAFYECNALESITLPASVTKIGDSALISCESLKQVRYEGTTDEWEEVEQGEGWLYETQVKKVRCSDGFGKLSKNAFGDDDEDEDEEPDTNDSEDDEIDTNDSDDWDEEEEEGDEAD